MIMPQFSDAEIARIMENSLRKSGIVWSNTPGNITIDGVVIEDGKLGEALARAFEKRKQAMSDMYSQGVNESIDSIQAVCEYVVTTSSAA